MKKYQVIAKTATFGVGMVLILTDTQAETRKDELTKTAKGYLVNSPISFKQDEILSVVSGNISKSLLSLLSPADKTESNENKADALNQDTTPQKNNFSQMKHQGFGNYDVFNEKGEKINEKALTKAEAERLFEGLDKENKDVQL